MSKRMWFAAALVVSLALLTVDAGAGGHNRGAGKGPGMQEKMMKAFKNIYLHQQELGVSDEQLAKVMAVKTDLKKYIIQKEADIGIVKVDIMSQLYADKLDLERIDPLIDQKYEYKKAKAKKLVEAMAKVKEILTPEQVKQLQRMCAGQGKCEGKPGCPLKLKKGSPKH